MGGGGAVNSGKENKKKTKEKQWDLRREGGKAYGNTYTGGENPGGGGE